MEANTPSILLLVSFLESSCWGGRNPWLACHFWTPQNFHPTYINYINVKQKGGKRTSIPRVHLQILSSGLCFSSCTWWMVPRCSETRKSNGVRMKVNPQICHNILLSQFTGPKTCWLSESPKDQLAFFGTLFRFSSIGRWDFLGAKWCNCKLLFEYWILLGRIFSKSSIFLLESCWRSVCMTIRSTPTWKRPWKKREDWLYYLWSSPQCIQFFDCCWTCDKHHNNHKPIHLGRLINMEPTNHPFRKDKWFSKPSWWCSMLTFRDVYESLFHRKSREQFYARWFKVPFSSPSWRSLKPLKGSLNHPKKVTLNHQVGFLSMCGTHFEVTLRWGLLTPARLARAVVRQEWKGEAGMD